MRIAVQLEHRYFERTLRLRGLNFPQPRPFEGRLKDYMKLGGCLPVAVTAR
jgi:hypothetical protein